MNLTVVVEPLDAADLVAVDFQQTFYSPIDPINVLEVATLL